MPFKPNYSFERNERSRAKDRKKQEKLRRREEETARRKSEETAAESTDGETPAAPEAALNSNEQTGS